MQDPPPPIYPPMKPQFPGQEHLKCPRCGSMNTKFCYYNNYNLSQPRHLCKSCKRYWTKGGLLRNIPVGGVSRKTTKRSSSSLNENRSPTTSSLPSPLPDADVNGSFNSLSASSTIGGHSGGFLDGSGMHLGAFPAAPNRNAGSGSGSDCVHNGGRNGQLA